MNVKPTCLLLFAVLLVSVAALVACTLPVEQFGSLAGRAMPPEVQLAGAPDRQASVPTGILRITVRWPEQDRPNFRAATIPTSTQALLLWVWAGTPGESPLVTGPIVIPRQAGVATVSKDVTLPEARNLTVVVKAYRDSNPNPDSANAIAQGTAAGINIAASQVTSAKLVLDAVVAPTISSLGTNLGPVGSTFVIKAANVENAAASLSVAINGTAATIQSLSGEALGGGSTLLGTASITVLVPSGAMSGKLKLVSDGITSASDATFWVVTAIEATASRAIWDPSPVGTLIVVTGQTLPFYGLPKAFAAKDGDDLSLLGASPSATMSVQGVLDNSAAGTFPEASSFKAADTAATASLKAKLGSVESASGISLSIEDVTVSLSPATGDVGPYGEPSIALVAKTQLTSGLFAVGTGAMVQFLFSDSATLSLIGSGATESPGWAACYVKPGSGYGEVVVTARSTLRSDRLATASIRVTGCTVSTLAGLAGSQGSSNGSGSAARFSYTNGVAVDATGSIYVADVPNQTIRKVTAAGVVTTLAGLAGSEGSSDGTGSSARFYYPQRIAVDPSGNIIVPDEGNHSIRKVTPEGVVTTLAGQSGSPGTSDGAGSSARFYLPFGVAVDATGNVYVADTFNHTIRKVTPGGVVTTLAGSAGSSGSSNGTSNTARFNNPDGLAVDAMGNVYLADTGNHTIRKVTPAGVVTTLAGLAGSSGSADGTGSTARFDNPHGVAVDATGHIYVAEGGHTIRRVTPEGVVTTLAGLAGSSGSANGPGTAARFKFPYGVAVDATGSVYVADTYNYTIRRISKLYP